MVLQGEKKPNITYFQANTTSHIYGLQFFKELERSFVLLDLKELKFVIWKSQYWFCGDIFIVYRPRHLHPTVEIPYDGGHWDNLAG